MPQITQSPIIGIAGPARVGKDTVANFILAEVGGYRYSFADPIYAMLRQLGIDMSDPYWEMRKEETIPALGTSPRHMMQTLGTEWGRQLINPDLWVILAHQRLLHNGPGMIVPGVRFENEALWIRKNGGRIIHLSCPDARKVKAHISENGVTQEPNDWYIYNDSTLEALQTKVKGIFDGQPKT